MYAYVVICDLPRLDGFDGLDQLGWSFQAAQESKVAREALLDWAQDRRGTWYRRRHCVDSIKQMMYDD